MQINDFVRPDRMRQIQPAAFRNDLIKLLINLMKRCTNLYRMMMYYRYMARKYKVILMDFQLLPRERNILPSSDRTESRRLEAIHKVTRELDATTSNIIDLSGKIGMNLIKENLTCNEVLKLQYQKVFIRDANVLTRMLDRDEEYASNIFFTGLIRGWSQQDFIDFNRVVKYYLHYVFLYMTISCMFLSI